MDRLTAPRLFSQRAFVGGAWISADDGRTVPVINPSTRRELGRIPRLGAAETRRAILAAEAAFPAWRRRPAHERGKILRTWAGLLAAHLEDLARIMTLEQDKPLAESRAEIVYAASFLEWFAEEGRRVYSDTIPAKQTDRRNFVLKEPVGVCAAITPWNFPAAMITRKAGPALATGCTIVIKPAEQTPYSALALAVLGEEAGIPAGVLSVVTGKGSEIGPEITASPVVRKLSFTGSTEVGRLLMQQLPYSTVMISWRKLPPEPQGAQVRRYPPHIAPGVGKAAQAIRRGGVAHFHHDQQRAGRAPALLVGEQLRHVAQPVQILRGPFPAGRERRQLAVVAVEGPEVKLHRRAQQRLRLPQPGPELARRQVPHDGEVGMLQAKR